MQNKQGRFTMSKKSSIESTADVTESRELTVPGETYLAFQSGADQTEWLAECAQAGLSVRDLEKIKVPGAGGLQWDLTDATGSTGASTFDGIVVSQQHTRAYWEHEYDGSNQPPRCSSQDGITGRGDPGGSCEDCPFNEWGSGKNGMGTACSQRTLLYVLREQDALPVVLSVPVTSATPFRQYRSRLLRARNMLASVVTRFALERAKSEKGIPYSKIVFTENGILPPSLRTAAKAYSATIKRALGLEREEEDRLAPAHHHAPVLAFDPNEIPESDPPFGRFAKQAPEEKEEIPF